MVLPEHDRLSSLKADGSVAYIPGAPNLINGEYLKQHSDLLLKHFSHLRGLKRLKVGVFLGGDTKKYFLSESQLKIIVSQLKEACEIIRADLLITTSRRTPNSIESLLEREVSGYPNCRLLILANRSNVAGAVGGILGLSDIAVVSADSISMVSEAASSGRNVVVFPLKTRKSLVHRNDKHRRFIEDLRDHGYIVLSNEKDLSQIICSMARNKMRTKILNNQDIILEAVRKVI